MGTFINKIVYNLFTFDEPDSVGAKLQLRFVEGYVIIYSYYYMWSWGYYIPRLSELVLPLGMANYIPVELFYDYNLSVYAALFYTIFTLIAFNSKKYRWLYALSFLLFHLQYVVRFSQGEIPHSTNLFGFTLLGLGLGGAFIKGIRNQLIFAFGLTIFFAGLGYTSAAISKLVARGIFWVDGNHLWLWIGEKKIDRLAKFGEFEYTFMQELALRSRTIATSVLIFGFVAEICAVLMFFKKYRWIFVSALVALHFGIYMTMNIFFSAATWLLVIIGFPWDYWINRSSLASVLNSNSFIMKYILYQDEPVTDPDQREEV
ncbi:MAG: hypothetical protein MI700_00975 [Balneolales bacterium]|nr:hypothetical protein [Balneolales bacterium]